MSPTPIDWTKYYEQTDPGTSTDILDTDEARQTTSLILQQASIMVAEGSDETHLIFATQTAVMVADLEIDGINPKEPGIPFSNTNMVTSSVSGVTVPTMGVMRSSVGVPTIPNVSGLRTTQPIVTDTRNVTPTASSMITGTSSTMTNVVPYDRGQASMPPYNSCAMYEDKMLPVYVDYIGNIMPILDRQLISTNWPPTPHPLMGQVRYMPYNSANMPTVPYMLSVGPQFLPQPIQGAPALSEVASGTQPGIQGDSVSQIGVSMTPVFTTPATSYVTFPLSTQSVLPATPAYEPT